MIYNTLICAWVTQQQHYNNDKNNIKQIWIQPSYNNMIKREWLDLDLRVENEGLTLGEAWHVDIWYVCTLGDKVKIGERRNRISLVSLLWDQILI